MICGAPMVGGQCGLEAGHAGEHEDFRDPLVMSDRFNEQRLRDEEEARLDDDGAPPRVHEGASHAYYTRVRR